MKCTCIVIQADGDTYLQTLIRTQFLPVLEVVGHPVRSAARLRIEIEWEICHVDLSLPSKCIAEIASQI